MKKEFDLLVFVGRFQPFHNEHKRIIDIALQKSKNVLVLVGSAGKARTIRNPFTYQERRDMIQQNFPHPYIGMGSEAYALPKHETPRLVIRPLFDKTYNDSAWIKQVQTLVNAVAMDIANPGMAQRVFRPNGIKEVKIGLIGASKDHSSYYLKMFPQWKSVDVPIEADIHATAIREGYFDETQNIDQLDADLPENVIDFLYGPADDAEEPARGYMGATFGFNSTGYFKQLQRELRFVRNYKKQWAVAPYPVKHMTVDAVVEQSGHILLVKRRSEPGKGLWALPGGHLEEFERLEDGMIRELREETKIKVPDPVLRGSIVAEKTFDDPYRSTIGRVITQAFHIKLADATSLPKVKGADDAEKAKWVPISELREEDFFDDHYFIIQYFLGL
jgi:bifunctional NMN adenylyltransferase/nudix hydrolase